MIYELSINSYSNEINQKKCIDFIIKTLLNSKSDENERNNFLINKVFDITNINIILKQTVIEMCYESIEKVNIEYYS